MIVAVTVRVIDIVVQLALVALGFVVINAEDDDSAVGLLVLWSIVGTLYWLASVIAVAVSLRVEATSVPRWVRLADANRIVGWVSTAATFFSTMVGLYAVWTMLVLRHDEGWSGAVEPIAVYAMLLAWALFHWGFARIYDRAYRRAPVPPLLFPGTDRPRLVDFVYFSFTNATAFSVSDVQVMTSRMRWTVMWHTTISFFLNALIIVLAFSTIINS